MLQKGWVKKETLFFDFLWESYSQSFHSFKMNAQESFVFGRNPARFIF